MKFFIGVGNFGQRRMSSLSSDGRVPLAKKSWCTHMAHFSRKSLLCSCLELVLVLFKLLFLRAFVVVLCWFCYGFARVCSLARRGFESPRLQSSFAACQRRKTAAAQSLRDEAGHFIDL